MILYFLPVIICYLSAISQIKSNLNWWCFIVFVLSIFLCGGYMCGSDWRVYETIYNSINFSHLFSDYYMEPGYYLYMLPFRILGLNFWTFIITTKLICFFSICNFIHKYARTGKFLALLLFIPFWGYYLFIDNPLRNLIAVTIFIYSFKYIETRNIKKFILMTCFAFSFHVSALVMLVIYWGCHHFPQRRLGIIIPIILLLFVNNKVLVSLIHLLSFNEFVQWKIDAYINSESNDGAGQLFSLKMLIFWVFYYVILLNKKYIEIRGAPKIIVNGALLFVLLYQIGLSFHIFFRFQLYLVTIFSVCVSILYSCMEYKSKPIFSSFIFIISLTALYNIRMDGAKYIPYTNYFFSDIKGTNETFLLRSTYNEKHTPYKDALNK